MAGRARIGSLWIDGPLSWIERASIASFLDLGHDYVLYTYGQVENAPPGTRIEDARGVWPHDDIIVHSRAQSPAIHADVFRAVMVRQTGRVWADTDVIALRPFPAGLDWFIGHERMDRPFLGNAVMGFPRHSRTMEDLWAFLTGDDPVPPWFNARGRRAIEENRANGVPVNLGDYPWGTTGPVALTHFAQATGEFSLAQPQATFFPVTFQQRKSLVHPALADTLDDLLDREQSLCVHLYGRWLRKYTGGGLPARTSWLGRHLRRHGFADYPADEPAAHRKGPKARPDPAPLPTEHGDAVLADLAARKAAAPDLARSPAHGRVVLLTMAKDEGPYVLEWVAYHHLMGFTDILAYSNDCTDGTDLMLDALAAIGLVTHLDNPPLRDLPPQSRALKRASDHPLIRAADWIMVMDLDEFLAVRCGAGQVGCLIDRITAAGATAMPLTWRFFGSAGAQGPDGRLVIERLTRAAGDDFVKGFGVKTLFRRMDHLRLAIHRPRIIRKRERQGPLDLNWINGSGDPVDGKVMSWRQTRQTAGYGLGQVNHYGVKSAEEYLLRRLRGDVLNNHGKYDRDYFARFDRNEVTDLTAAAMAPRVAALTARLLREPAVARAARVIADRYADRLARLRAAPDYARMMAELRGTGA